MFCKISLFLDEKKIALKLNLLYDKPELEFNVLMPVKPIFINNTEFHSSQHIVVIVEIYSPVW